MVKIGFDIDGVCLDFHGKFLDFVYRETGKRITIEEITKYNFWEALGGTKEYWIGLCAKFYATTEFANLDAVEGAKEGVSVLVKSHELVNVTSRLKSLEDITSANMGLHFKGDFSKLILTDFWSGTGKNKDEICVAERVEVMVDDCLQTTIDCSKAGIQSYLFDLNGRYGWSKPQNYGITLPEKIKKVISWNELVSDINREYNH